MASFDRRQILAGAGCLCVPPLLRSVLAAVEHRASGSDAHPMRFVFCLKSNGLWAEMIQPMSLLDRLPFKVAYDDRGRLVAGDQGRVRKLGTPAADLEIEADPELSTVMASLRPFRERLSVLQGINSGFNVYHKGQYQTLGAFQGRFRGSIETLGPTVDSLPAQAHSGPVPHVCLGHDPTSPSGVAYVPTSAAGQGKPIPFYTKPRRAYKELFGVVGEGTVKQGYEAQSDILDFYADDFKGLQKNIAGPEREQLERYLNAFDSLRESRKKVEQIVDQLRKYAPRQPGDIEAQATMAIGSANTDIAIASLLSGLTNVVTLRFDLLGSTSYEGVGSLHAGIGHGQVKNIVEARRKVCSYHFEQIARMAKALKGVPEGDGSMLDNTVFIYTSDNGETHHSSGVNYPILILGDLGKRLRSRRYFSPGNEEKLERSKPGYTRLGDVWATLLAAAGRPHKEFGLPVNGVPHRPLEALMA